MLRALELAAGGRGAVEPNPMVGAVIVREGRIIGEGFHRRFGGPHAEIEALNAARAAGQDVAGATAYITLEPCCHHGKTPPCTRAMLDARVGRVVAAMEDPDEKVAGRGLEELRRAGIEVVVGVCQEQARRLLAAYIKLRTLRRPWVICKWAQSLDGRIATATGHSQWLTGAAARRRVHEIRSFCDGICVGVGTVLKDDPRLTNRSGASRQSARLVLDQDLQTPIDARLLDKPLAAPVIVATSAREADARAAALTQAGAEVLALPAGAAGGVDLEALLDELGRRQWTYLLVEGGRGVLGQFLRQKLADELLVFIAPLILGGAGSLGPVDWHDVETIDQGLPLPAPSVELIGNDVLLTFRLR